MYDSWLLPHVLGVPLTITGSESESEIITKFGKSLKSLILTTLQNHPQHGVYLESCHHHTFISKWATYYNTIAASSSTSNQNKSDITIPKGLYKWYHDQRVLSHHNINFNYYFQEENYPCDDCCNIIKFENNEANIYSNINHNDKSNNVEVLHINQNNDNNNNSMNFNLLVVVILSVVILIVFISKRVKVF